MKKRRILIVDDDRVVSEVFATAFERQYDIVPALDGRQALSILGKPHTIDLVFLDVNMPGLSGLELLRQIKHRDASIKVILLTGYGYKEVMLEALRADADDFIEKPFDLAYVEEVIKKFLPPFPSGSTQAPPDKITAAREFIERNFEKELTLHDVAGQVFLSPKYFSRIFQEKTGTTFNAFRVGLRIQKAKQLLKKRDLTVSQVASMVGYETPDAFMKVFKKVTGTRPSEYRGTIARESAKS
jgi:YesN/AraC family two-component response regulator